MAGVAIAWRTKKSSANASRLLRHGVPRNDRELRKPAFDATPIAWLGSC
jgi:hypothetical protein